MNLYYHHVGATEGTRDLHRTVFKTVSFDTVSNGIPLNNPHRQTLLDRLAASFPNGEFNAWGVPAGASKIIRSLQVGDVVLIVEQATEFGDVPVLCPVAVYIPEQFPGLSNAFWNSDRFPFVFFFRTQLINLRWRDFQDHLGYATAYNPRGTFSSISKERVQRLEARFGSIPRYVDYLRNGGLSSDRVFGPIVYEDRERYDLTDDDEIELINDSLGSLSSQIDDDPSLLGGSAYQTREVTTRPRDAAFRISVLRAYEHRCAVCGDGVIGPHGEYEVQAAHIYPKGLDGNDDVRNGVCLCRRHHWAFDVGWMYLEDDLTIRVRPGLPDSEEYAFIRSFDRKTLRAPSDGSLTPHPKFIQEVRALYDANFNAMNS